MSTEQFAYWLQGFAELHGAPPSAEQWKMIKEHLDTCFVKVTGKSKSMNAQDFVLLRQQGGTGTIPDYLKQINQRSTGGNEWVPPVTITC